MLDQARIEALLVELSGVLVDQNTPPKLVQAIDYALFPGGARVRPRLVLAVSEACAPGDTGIHSAANASAAAVEMMHCASLIQDDLQCFDDADLRRGKKALHKKWGAGHAILTADALIVGCFQLLADITIDPVTSAALIRKLVKHTGSCGGITAGQAWEAEESVDLNAYHASKTGSLFAAATELGAISAGARAEDWSRLGQLIGSAYQIADDIRDTLGSSEEMGKHIGKDVELQRPNVVVEFGIDDAVARLKCLVEEVIESVPDCPDRLNFTDIVQQEARRFIPKEVGRYAA